MALVSFPERVTAFVDILGSKDALKESEELSLSLLGALQEMRSRASESQSKDPALSSAGTCVASVQAPLYVEGDPRDSKCEISAFSDCIVISNEGPLAYSVIPRVQDLVITVLSKHGRLCRGAIVKEKLYHEKGLLTGPALVTAHDLERNVAKYPRVIVSQDVAEGYQSWIRRLSTIFTNPDDKLRYLSNLPYAPLIETDFDGLSIIQIFEPNYELTEQGWNLDGRRWQEDFMRIRATIQDNLSQTRDDPGLRSKFYWLARHFNKSVQDQNFARRVACIEPIPLT